jgi:hypothetical protein
MEWTILLALVILPFVINVGPAPGLFESKTDLRRLECERLSALEGASRYPGEVITSPPRGDFIERSVLVCNERFLGPDVRPNRDEAVLSTLSAQAASTAARIDALSPELRARTWLVETHYESSQVAGKISFAAQTALGEKGLRVSDRTPVLAAGDVAVITRMEPAQAYPAACQRYFDNQSMGTGDALLAIVSRDPRETALHAGLCVDGQWSWLQ